MPIPGPAGHPLLGMARELRRDPLGTLMENFRRYGDLVLYRVGPAPAQRHVVAVHHPDQVQRVFADDRVFTRATTSLGVVAELFGQNLVTTDSDVWLRQRRTLQPLFTHGQVGAYRALIEAEARRAVADRALASGGVVDIAKLTERYTLRVLGQTLFQGPGGLDRQSVADLGRLVPIVGEAIRSRGTQAVRLPLAWPTARNRRFVRTRRELHAIADRVLAKRSDGERGAGAEDLLGRLLDAREAETGAALSAQEVRDQVLMFLFAGHTTTTSALTSTLYLLAGDQQVQELVAQAAASPSDGGPDQDLVLAAVKEGLRLYPPSSVLGRRVLTDAEIDGWPIRAGTNVLVSAWVTHRHPGFWKQPERFDPARFIGRQTRPQYAYFPFGGGPRTCIGRHFALLEATTLVRELLRSYRLVATDGTIPLAQLASLRPSGPVRVRCQRRIAGAASTPTVVQGNARGEAE